MFYKTKTLLLLLAFVTANTVFAQEKKEDTKEEAKSYFKLDANFVNNSVYLGRKDSMTLPYLTPSIGYYHKSGFYAEASLAYLIAASEKRVDYYSLNVGYDFSISKKLSGSISANKSFYNDSSSNVSSSIGGSLSGGLTYDFSLFELSSSLSASFAEKTDIGIDVAINRAFSFGEEGNQWTINPKALVNFSTLNFYEGYTTFKS